MDPGKKGRVLELNWEKYGDFGPTLAYEPLVKEDEQEVRVEMLRQRLIGETLWAPRRRRPAHRRWRERKADFGEMVQSYETVRLAIKGRCFDDVFQQVRSCAHVEHARLALHNLIQPGQRRCFQVFDPPLLAVEPKQVSVRHAVHVAIIDQQTFDAVQQRLSERKQRTTPHKNGGKFLLTGLLHCGKCGGRMFGTDPRKTQAVSYICGTDLSTDKCDRNAAKQDE